MPSTARTFNRRQVVIAGIVGFQGLSSLAFTKDQYLQENHEQGNFAPLTEAELLELGPAETAVPLQEIAGTKRTFQFSLEQQSLVYLTASADSAQATVVHPLIAQWLGGPKLLIPLVRSGTPGRRLRTSIVLGTFSAGDHSFSIDQDPALSLPIPDSLHVVAKRPTLQSVMASFVGRTPAIWLKNRHNVLDDIPLVSFSLVNRNLTNGHFQVKSYVLFSSENGGMFPVHLYRDFHRTFDYEWMMRQLFRSTGTLLKGQLYQERDHKTQRFYGQSIMGGKPLLIVATPNNNFADGAIHIGPWHVPHWSSEPIGDVIYAPKPTFHLSPESIVEAIAKTPEYEQWGIMELYKEGCIDLGDTTDPRVVTFMANQQWVDQFLTVSYPNRGCGRHKLLLPR